ncbi:MAG: hypothetical protein ACYTGN_19025, partial [Planctomycetota bacterium]
MRSRFTPIAALLAVAGPVVIVAGAVRRGAMVPVLLASLGLVVGGAWIMTLRCWDWPAPARKRYAMAAATGLFWPAVVAIGGQAFRISCGDSVFPWGSMVYLAAIATLGITLPLFVAFGELAARRLSTPVMIGGLVALAAPATWLVLETYYSRFFAYAYVFAWTATIVIAGGVLGWGLTG